MAQINLKELLEKAKANSPQPNSEVLKKFRERAMEGFEKLKQKQAEKKAAEQEPSKED